MCFVWSRFPSCGDCIGYACWLPKGPLNPVCMVVDKVETSLHSNLLTPLFKLTSSWWVQCLSYWWDDKPAVLIIMHKCASLMCKMDAMCIKFVTTASPGRTRFELDAFNITSMYQSFGQCVMASLVLKKVHMCKVAYISGNSSRNATWPVWCLCMNVFWDSWHLMWPFPNVWWPRWKKGNKVSILWPPKFKKKEEL